MEDLLSLFGKRVRELRKSQGFSQSCPVIRVYPIRPQGFQEAGNDLCSGRFGGYGKDFY